MKLSVLLKVAMVLFILQGFVAVAQQDEQLAFKSDFLAATRQVQIHLPKDYGKTETTYPVIYSLDGEYTKLIMNGMSDFYSFWDKIPPCIVVSIDQNYMDTTAKRFRRWLDCDYNSKSGMPEGQGLLFKKFISQELIPYVDSAYPTTSFRAIVGHSFTANYINYFLMDEEPLFQGYLVMSPYFAKGAQEALLQQIKNLKSPVFYYLAAGEHDLSRHIQSVSEFDKQVSKLENPNFIYKKFDLNGNGATHATVVSQVMPYAITHLFSSYAAIDDDEFDRLLKIQDKVRYIMERYEFIEKIYGIKLEIREDDINTVSYAISKKKQWGQLKRLGEMTLKLYPDSYMGYWILGEYEEKQGNYAAALQQYETGISKLGEDVANVADFQVDIDRMKKKL